MRNGTARNFPDERLAQASGGLPSRTFSAILNVTARLGHVIIDLPLMLAFTHMKKGRDVSLPQVF